MLQFEELRLELLSYKDKLYDLAEAIGLAQMKKEVSALEEQSADENFWNDLKNSQKILQRISTLKSKTA